MKKHKQKEMSLGMIVFLFGAFILIFIGLLYLLNFALEYSQKQLQEELDERCQAIGYQKEIGSAREIYCTNDSINLIRVMQDEEGNFIKVNLYNYGEFNGSN